MGSILDAITNWIKGGLVDAIMDQYAGIFSSINDQVQDVAAQVGQTPQGWNSNIFNMIRTLSETVVIPIAGMILTFVLVYELIQMILEKNNMHEFDTFTALKEDSYSKNIYGQIGKAKFICITALQAEMERLIVFDSVFNSNHPELVDEILELFQAILALEDARL